MLNTLYPWYSLGFIFVCVLDLCKSFKKFDANLLFCLCQVFATLLGGLEDLLSLIFS